MKEFSLTRFGPRNAFTCGNVAGTREGDQLRLNEVLDYRYRKSEIGRS